MKLLEEWAAANPRSRELHERARRVIPSGVTHDIRHMEPFPLAVATAHGSHKTDLDGHDLVCYTMGHGALLLGHDPAPVMESIAAGPPFLHAGASHELEVEWAERICGLVPSAERVCFTSSGTEATMLALQVARGFTGRDRVLKIEGHFHGWHDTAGYGADLPHDDAPVPGIPAVLSQVITVVPPDPAAVETALAGRDVAALILEPTGASWGAVPVGFDVLAQLRELTRSAGTLLIFDEVVGGFRWSPGGVQQLAGVTPDLTTMAKIVAGGLPGGAVGGRADVMDVLAFRSGDGVKVRHPGTHNAHPLAAAAGIAMLAAIADGAAQSRADETSEWLRRELGAALQRSQVPGFIWGESSTFRVALGWERPSGPPDGWWRTAGTAALKQPMPHFALQALQAGMLLEGVHLFHGCGLVSSVHTEADVERTVRAFERTVVRMRDEGAL
jgi:glutamate-1-semialdehyde 2,1-aminomutase